MDRRKALKNISLGFGAVVATPAILNILSSCTTDKLTWRAKFLNTEEQIMVTHLADVILPVSDIPGALNVNIPQFIDKIYALIESDENKMLFHQGASLFAKRFEAEFKTLPLIDSRGEIEKFFEKYFKVEASESDRILSQQRKHIDEISEDYKDNYLMYSFLFSVRYYTLFGYFTSEQIGKEVLNYDPIPGRYDPCVPLDSIGNAWTL